MDLRESWIIWKRENSGHECSHMEDEVDSLGYSHPAEVRFALRRWWCGLNPLHISACRRKYRSSDHVATEDDEMADVQNTREFIPRCGEYK